MKARDCCPKRKELHRRKKQTERTLRRSEKAVERRLKKQDKLARREANSLHKTYQSPRETEAMGCMSQHIVNRVLSMFGGK